MICSYLVLLVVLRSVLLPLKAVLMNLLSVGAAYGVLVVVFQYGWLDGISGYNSLGYVNAVTPPLLLAIVFGLSMDYEVFLLSRIRERYLATGDNRLAVAEGLQASAKVISSAAIIMVVVFGVFATTGVPQIKEIGLGPGGRDRARRDARAARARAGDDAADGRVELVDAGVARARSCPTRTSNPTMRSTRRARRPPSSDLRRGQ